MDHTWEEEQALIAIAAELALFDVSIVLAEAPPPAARPLETRTTPALALPV